MLAPDTSVVLFVINAVSITSIKFESDTPRPVNMDRVSFRLAAQRVKVEAWKVHFFRSGNEIETLQT